MITFHGWISLSSDSYDIDDEKEEALIAAFRSYIKTEHPVLNQEDMGCMIRYNGVDTYMFSGAHDPTFDPMTLAHPFLYDIQSGEDFYGVQILKWVAENGPGSYGLLYVRDDDDRKRDKNYGNEFRVWVLKRGNVYEMDDPFLSPFVPECSD